MTILKTQKQQQLIPVVSLPDVESGIRLAKILLRCKMEMVEITFRTSHAVKGIAAIKKQFPEVRVIAGTVLTADQIEAALDAGAEAIVSPGFDPILVAHCQKLGVSIFPGVCTPSDIQLAISMGVFKLKFFPAEICGGVRMVKLLLDVYQEISLMPTGGITPDNMLDYLGIDRVFCCGGTWLAPMDMMVAGDWAGIEKRIQVAVRSLQNLFCNTNPK